MKKVSRKLAYRKLNHHDLMGTGIDALDATAKESDPIAKAVGSAAGVATPVAAVTATTAVTGTAGGAAIMQTLAAAGALVGGGALAGIAVLGVGSVLVGWGVTKSIRRLRSRRNGG